MAKRPWEEETGIWSYPEVWTHRDMPSRISLMPSRLQNIYAAFTGLSQGGWQKRYETEGLGKEYDPTFPTDVPDYPSVSSLMDSLLNLRRREPLRKGRASTRVTRGDLGDVFLSKPGLFPI